MNLSRKVAIRLAKDCQYHSAVCHRCRRNKDFDMSCCAYCIDLHDCQLSCMCPIIKEANK